MMTFSLFFYITITTFFLQLRIENVACVSFQSNNRRSKFSNTYDPGNINEAYNKNAFQYDYEDAEPEITYPGEEFVDYENEKASRSAPKDIVKDFTSSPLTLFIVSISSSLVSVVVSNFVLTMLLSKAPLYLVLASALVSFASCYIPGSLGEFNKALGVLSLLIIQKQTVLYFAVGMYNQLLAAMMLKDRQAYPGEGSPWSYVPVRENDVDFRMRNVLIHLVVLGAFMGYFVASFIPLFPNFIGALIGSGFLGYKGTVVDPLGDLIRFCGQSSVSAIDLILSTSSKIQLRRKGYQLFSIMMDISTRLDQQYSIVARIKQLLNMLFFTLLGIFNRMRNDAAKGEQAREEHHYSEDDFADDEYNPRKEYRRPRQQYQY